MDLNKSHLSLAIFCKMRYNSIEHIILEVSMNVFCTGRYGITFPRFVHFEPTTNMKEEKKQLEVLF